MRLNLGTTSDLRIFYALSILSSQKELESNDSKANFLRIGSQSKTRSRLLVGTFDRVKETQWTIPMHLKTKPLSKLNRQ
jgi:hypothetical protein